MKIFNLGEIDNNYIEAVGGKARGLNNLIKKGFSVPQGFVLVDFDKNNKDNIVQATEYFLNSDLKKVAVRSSASAEDGADFSYAGQFKTFLNIDNVQDFAHAVISCIESLSNGPGKDYNNKFGDHSIKMNVVVQCMIDADYAGVCFTQDPNNKENMLIEAVAGLGEALVSGEVSGEQYIVPLTLIENNNNYLNQAELVGNNNINQTTPAESSNINQIIAAESSNISQTALVENNNIVGATIGRPQVSTNINVSTHCNSSAEATSGRPLASTNAADNSVILSHSTEHFFEESVEATNNRSQEASVVEAIGVDPGNADVADNCKSVPKINNSVGRVDPDTPFKISNNIGSYEQFCANKKLLIPQMLHQICTQAIAIKNVFNGTPLDLEWAIQDGMLYWLQARPITTLEEAQEDEFDPQFNLIGHTVTRCNIGEMLPGAITPLTHSVSLFAIDWGLREMLRVAGAVKRTDDLPPYSCAFSTSGHLFLNLSTLYRLTNAAFLTDKNNVDFSICGRALEEQGVVPGKKAWFLRRLKNTFAYLKFVLSSKKARQQLIAIADNFTISKSNNAIELYNTIDKNKHISDRVALLHYITSAHAGAMSSALIKSLQKKISDIEECKTILAKVLEGIDGIESVDILASLKRIAKTILEENPNAVNYNTSELSLYLKNAGEQVQAACATFFHRHGHRAIREAELRNKGWAEDREAFLEYLKTVIASGKVEPEPLPAPNLEKIFKDLGFKRTGKLMFFARQARQGVRNREYSKSKLIKVLNEFKKAYSQLATILVSDGKLPDEDAVFFLTHQELATLIINKETWLNTQELAANELTELANKASAALVKKVLQRRRLLASQSVLRFREIYLGKPESLPVPTLADVGNTLQGTAISRGLVTGPARVVRNTEDAAQLKKGEIMVAVFTDIGWSPYYCLIEGLVTEIGSALSHGAVVAREYALPFVSNIQGAVSIIKTGDVITVDGATGKVVVG